MRYFSLAGLALAGALVLAADVRDCACDAAKPETMAARECSLCREAEKQPAGAAVFFLKDSNPRKPNRTLVLPRAHGKGPHSLAELSARDRTEFWTAAIAKAKQLWGAQWGVAMNGDMSRTQCHMHAHVGKLLEGIETRTLVVVDTPAAIPVPEDNSGLWIHPHEGKLHVHLGEQITETVLMR